MNRWLFLFLLIFIWSCGLDINKKRGSVNKYFDINGLIEQQVNMLDSVSPSLLKTATIDGVDEHNLLTSLNHATWTKELAIFKSADINNPRMADSYQFVETNKSGIKTIIYKSKFPKTTSVDSLAISFTDTGKNPIKLHARVRDGNALFESDKTMKMMFTIVNNQNMLSSYRIEGWQKMISKDSTTYLIEGLVQ